MQISLPGDRISELLHVVLIEICQKIISYTNELVVTGVVSVTADGIEVCRVPFDDCINKGESGTYGGGDGIARKKHVSETDNLSSPVTFDQNGIGSSGSTKGSGDYGDIEEESSGVNAVECVVPALTKAKDRLKCHFTTSCTTRNALLESDKNCRDNDLDKLQSSSSIEIGSLAGNLHEIIMEYWERITPELLRASELLCRLGEIQHLVGNNGLTVDDCSTSLNLHRNFKKCNNNFDKEALNSCSRSGLLSEESASSPLEFQPPMSVCQADSKCRACRRTFTDLLQHKKRRKLHATSCHNTARNSKISQSCSSTGVISFSDCRNTIDIAKVPVRGGCVRSVEASLVKSGRNLDRQTEQGATKADRDAGDGTLTADTFQEMEDAKQDTESSASGHCLEKELEVCDDVEDNDIGAGHKSEFTPAKDVDSSVSEDDDSALFESGSTESLKASISACDKGNDQCLLNNGRNQDTRKMSTSSDVNGDNASNLVEESCSLNATFTSEALSLASQNNPRSNVKVSSPELLTSTDVLFKTKKFDCSMCKASFSMLSNLQRHTRKIHGTTKDTHSRSVPAFEPVLDVLNVEPPSDLRTSRSSRYRHICVFCDAAFTFRTNLTRHMKKIHGKIPIDVADQPGNSQPVK